MDIEKIIKLEKKRQNETINLIASENLPSAKTLRILGSIFNNKYAEGYPSKRYYNGNKNVDIIENECKKNALDLFKLSSSKWDVNVQSYSGSIANLSIYSALVPFGEKIMGMTLDSGGHLTHCQKLTLSCCQSKIVTNTQFAHLMSV